ncbi:hypothetical protein N5863_16430 [Klebsiella pasteurii]|uniref:hypothetical protein n=1 Tax=Klebsiella pasteurii TaxID=2587529 RepID=UPI002542F0C7|nr:hypothetical protein [Klebsiella pasteurii]WII79959.1 hypothetical protein N5863_16430 [Klebsiella pasteurii]
MAADELNPPLGTTTPEIFLDNVKRADRLVNGPAGTVDDRGGEPLDTWRQMMAKNDEVRQNIIPLSKQYMTLAAAQADIANIPVGATTYYRSPDDSALAIEVINNGGTLEATGRLMISKEYVDALIEAINQRINPLQKSPDSLFDIVSSNGIRPFRVRSNDGVIEFESIAKLVTGDSGLNFNNSAIDNNAPDGWIFLIYSRNGLVIAGVKEDGTKVGWGGSDSGGGQSGGITPGDVSVGYDDIRNYTGEATVRDVVGERIGGRFVVDASDTTSADDGGGVLVGVDGRRWIRQCDFVSYDMFGAPRIAPDTAQNYELLSKQGSEESAQLLLADQEPADQAIANCHAFANKHAIPVIQNVGHFLWVSQEIEVRTKMVLTGCTIVTCNRSGTTETRWSKVDGVNDGAPEPMYMYRITGKSRIDFTAAELNELNTTYSSYLKRGSMKIPMPKLFEYRGGFFGYISSAVELYRNANHDNVRQQVHYRDFTRLGRNGAVSDPLVKSIPAGTVNEAWIQPKEDFWLDLCPPRFFEAGNGRKFVNIQLQRSQVNIDNFLLENFATGDMASRTVIGSYGVTDIRCRNAAAECLPDTSQGAYVLCFRNSISIHVDGYYGMYGWGFQGHHGLKRVFIERSELNRFDFHSFGYDVYMTGCRFKGKQVYIQGGGQYVLRDNEFDVVSQSNTQGGTLEFRLDYFINMREDYAGDCECNLLIDGLVVRFARDLITLGSQSFDVVRMNSGTNGDYGVTTKTPYTISGKDIVFDLDGTDTSLPDNFAFTFCRPYRTRYNAAQKTFLPDMVRLQNMTAINVPATKNAVMAVFRCGSDMAQNPFGSRNKVRPNGTNAEIIAEDVISVINNPVIAQNACPTVYMPGDASAWDTVVDGTTYRTSEYSYRPRVTLRNCYPSIINATGVKAEFDISGGLLARYSVGDTGNRCRVTGADIQLYPDSAGVLYFDSDKVRTANCDWFDPAAGATYSGTLTGVGNENRGTTEHSPNI